jgi:hypothetical protein
MEKGNWQNKWMRSMVMGKCQNRLRGSCITWTNCKHFKGGYGKLPLGNVRKCHKFLQRLRNLEEVDSKTFFHKLIDWFVDIRFGNLLQLVINRIYESSKTTLCNSRQASLNATWIYEQSVKTSYELLDDKVGPKTKKCVQ